MLGKQKRIAMYLLNTRNFTPVKPTLAQYALYNSAMQNIAYLRYLQGSKLVCVIQGYFVMHHTYAGKSYYAICRLYKNGSCTKTYHCTHYITTVQQTIASIMAFNAKCRGTNQSAWYAGYVQHMQQQYGLQG